MNLAELKIAQETFIAVVENTNHEIVFNKKFKEFAKKGESEADVVGILGPKAFNDVNLDGITVKAETSGEGENQEIKIIVIADGSNDILADCLSLPELKPENPYLDTVQSFVDSLPAKLKTEHQAALDAYGQAVYAFEQSKADAIAKVVKVLGEHPEAMKTLQANRHQIMADALGAILTDSGVGADDLADLDLVLYFAENKTATRTRGTSAKAGEIIEDDKLFIFAVNGIDYVLGSNGSKKDVITKAECLTGCKPQDVVYNDGKYSIPTLGIAENTRADFYRDICGYAAKNNVAIKTNSFILTLADYKSGKANGAFTVMKK